MMLLFKSFSNTLLNTERRQYRAVFLAAGLHPTFLNMGTTSEAFQRSGQDSFRHILKSSASMYESSGSQFFRISTGIQSGPDNYIIRTRFIQALNLQEKD